MWVFEWTGEQFLPAIKDASDVYQHLHRYLYASELLKGKRVLDMVAGDGSGSNILARSAASVVGMVIDERVAQHAGQRFNKPNIRFISRHHGSAIPNGQSFDAAVYFDAAQQVVDEASFFADIKRLLKQDGVFVTSIRVDEERKEPTIERLRQLLSPHFQHVQLFGQSIHAGSTIWPIGPDVEHATREIVMGRDGAREFTSVSGEDRPASSLIAVATDVPGPIHKGGSLLVDEGNELLLDKEKTIQELLENKAYQARALDWCNSQLAERRESLASLQQAYAWHKTQIESLNKTREYLEGEINHYRNAIASNGQALQWRAGQVHDLEETIAWRVRQAQALEEALAWRASQIEQLETGLAWRTSQVEELQRAVDELSKSLASYVSRYETAQRESQMCGSELDAIKTSAGWRFVLRVRAMREHMAPAGSLRYRVYEKIMRFAKSRG